VHGLLAVGAGLEKHLPVSERKQSEILAGADAGTRVHLVAALADDDVAGGDHLAAVLLHAQVLRVGVAAVLGGAGTLLVRSLHGERADGRAGGGGHRGDAPAGNGGVARGEAGDDGVTHESGHDASSSS
jgi:hypothetical protein